MCLPGHDFSHHPSPPFWQSGKSCHLLVFSVPFSVLPQPGARPVLELSHRNQCQESQPGGNSKSCAAL